MKRSAVTILLSLFLGCLAYQFFIYYKPYFSAINMNSIGAPIVIITCFLVPVAAGLLAIASTHQPKTTRRHPTPSIQAPQRSTARPTARPTALPRPAQPQPQPTAQSHKQTELYRQLINLLHGDADAAQRLLDLSIERNPLRGVVWNLEKVIYDLVRDRGGKPTPPPVKRDYRDYRDC